LQASLARAGLALPWWVAAVGAGAALVFAAAAIAQRAGRVPPPLLALAGLLVLVSVLVYAVTGEIAPPWLKAGTVIACVAVLVTAPVAPDFAPVVLAVLTAETAVTARPPLAATVAGASGTVLVAAAVTVGLVGAPIYLAAVLLGLTGGLMFRWYVRALEAERAAQETGRQRAVLAERQHIAREVHDVVAHSLSITLLHLTGARRALQQDRDVDDAVESLTEAERVGRAAMADIRRTVGLLAATTAGTRPLPGADDIAALVDQTRAAGLDVHYEQHGDLTTVGPTAGLGLYRIAQESLANVVKHAPQAAARLRLEVDRAAARLTVRNDLRSATPGPSGVPGSGPGAGSVGGGSGLAGMSARAAQLGARLHAGPSGTDWVVDLTVPGPLLVRIDPEGHPDGAATS
jgi:signal transduction histidine kinase